MYDGMIHSLADKSNTDGSMIDDQLFFLFAQSLL